MKIPLFVDTALDKIARFDWSRMVPQYKIDRFGEFGIGACFTWKLSGPGFAFGFNKVDVWVGWPPLHQEQD